MDDESNFITFTCEKCRTEIQASLDMIGLASECPACGNPFVVPDTRDLDQLQRHRAGEANPTAEQAMKSRTIRIELTDDF